MNHILFNEVRIVILCIFVTKFDNTCNSQDISFQRFEHSNRLHKKISTFISFPEHLDMTPFMSNRRNNNNNHNGVTAHPTDINNR